ncbi:hypothetical protein A1O1_08143 [Capronia coronata CBS 617.96]|uniref:Uncharacterized protein n=1 Tax=Capronia coronata CBS 617.96 TaxID=1182541 RepID=W9YIE9_9EURO|nr:uncharacterized protein A1O1_08143 [Capronia coronata CBS 617.96]EXJ82074.1 hypothetical protein A1O1_08143 [Capronia coronata CBS 617.96]
MNAARQLTSRRLVTALGPRLSTPAARYSSTVTGHQMTPKDRSMMHSVFGAATVATIGGVTYAAARSGSRVNRRFSQRDSSLDSSKWFTEGADVNNLLAKKH